MQPDSKSRQTRKLFAALLNAEVFPYIDKARFITSLPFREMLNQAVQDALEHRNTNGAMNLLIPFSKTRYFKPLACFLTDWAALVIKVEKKKPGVTIHLSAATPKRDMTLTAYLEQWKNNVEDAFGQRVEEDGSRNEKYLDAMDSRARLPGSFESGKRR